MISNRVRRYPSASSGGGWGRKWRKIRQLQKTIIDDSNLGRKKCPKKNPVDLKLIVSFMERTLVETRKNLCYFSSVYQ